MPVAHFYNRSLFAVLAPVPEQLLHIGTFIGSRAANIADANARFHLVHCENIATRLAHSRYFELSIQRRLASTDEKYILSLEVQALLVAYLGAVKSYLDAIATCLDAIYVLDLKPMNVDLCRPVLLERLGKINANVAERYAAHSDLYEHVATWRNAALHSMSPLVMECGPSSARPGSATLDQNAPSSELRLINIPGFSPGDLASAPERAIWVSPNTFFSSWNEPVDDLLTLVCDDIAANCPPD